MLVANFSMESSFLWAAVTVGFGPPSYTSYKDCIDNIHVSDI